MEVDNKNIEPILAQVERPGRYTGNEYHVIKKNSRKTEVYVVLAFPDVYEIGMSHLGLGILYHILNQQEWIAAERTYSPWVDMETGMKERGIPLFSIESRRPVHDCDILGITLQYELHYTNVLNLLDLADIPLYSHERTEKDPLVIAGGPCAYNPEPLADFLDCVVLGDGEEVVIEIAELVRESKVHKWERIQTLKALSGLSGVYVPSLYQAVPDAMGFLSRVTPSETGVRKEIGSRIIPTLALKNYPVKPLVPVIDIIHDRFSLEIMRGCSRGCRFCHAGIIYRPVRERRVEDLISQAREVMKNTGYDEISLVSLSTSDYSRLNELLSLLRNIFIQKGVSISFPSLRPETFTCELADCAVGLRRSGLTLAPEAGTQRLRNVINKNNSEEDLLKAIQIAYECGWQKVKLYFMIGLPTETIDDLKGIVDLVRHVIHLGRGYGKKEIHVSISPFSPKAHTPFQWEAQDTPDMMNEKIAYLRNEMSWKEVKLNWRDPRVSQLEATLSRGDRRLGQVIYNVWQKGARFDAWSDHFNYDIWTDAMKENKLAFDSYTGKRSVEEVLPWDHLNKGVSKSFLIEEREKAFSETVTQDCRSSKCHRCGLTEQPTCREIAVKKKNRPGRICPTKSDVVYGRKIRRELSEDFGRRIRIQYTKGDGIRFTSHLNTVQNLTRAFRRANIPMKMTKGFHAHPKMATGPPLPLGYTSQAEYLDLEINGRQSHDFQTHINRFLPNGLMIVGLKEIYKNIPSLNSSINLASYRVIWDGLFNLKDIERYIDSFLKRNTFEVIRQRKGIEKKVDIRHFVDNIFLNSDGMNVWVHLGPKGTVRVEEVVQAILPHFEEFPEVIKADRTAQYIVKQGKRMSPLDSE